MGEYPEFRRDRVAAAGGRARRAAAGLGVRRRHPRRPDRRPGHGRQGRPYDPLRRPGAAPLRAWAQDPAMTRAAPKVAACVTIVTAVPGGSDVRMTS